MAKAFLRRHVMTILAHISAWGVFLSIPFLMRRQEAFQPPPKFKEMPVEGMLLFSLFLITVFYTNYGLLVPRLLNRVGVRYYLPFVIVTFFAYYFLVSLIRPFISQVEATVPPLVILFPFLLVMAMSLSIRLLVDRTEVERTRKERENETLKSELSFLRSQISPHFLFNVMNNVVALSRMKPNLVEPTLIKLSNLMRYMLYNSDEKKVNIAKEVEYLESYIDLQKLRVGDSVEVVFNKNISTTQASLNNITDQIEPMLLIPFVENAFKHGIGTAQQPRIIIDLSLDKSLLTFAIINAFDPLSNAVKDRDSGIGLKNVNRRLELLYDKKQNLRISTEGGVFEVHLTIDLNQKGV
jgi:two-component system, LytTR family, sensor kinase